MKDLSGFLRGINREKERQAQIIEAENRIEEIKTLLGSEGLHEEDMGEAKNELNRLEILLTQIDGPSLKRKKKPYYLASAFAL